jgi:hypothetical protein
MGNLFSSPKSLKLPVVEEEPPITEDEIAGEESKKKRRKGRAETIITGDLEPITTKKTLLG